MRTKKSKPTKQIELNTAAINETTAQDATDEAPEAVSVTDTLPQDAPQAAETSVASDVPATDDSTADGYVEQRYAELTSLQKYKLWLDEVDGVVTKDATLVAYQAVLRSLCWELGRAEYAKPDKKLQAQIKRWEARADELYAVINGATV